MFDIFSLIIVFNFGIIVAKKCISGSINKVCMYVVLSLPSA